MSEPLFLTSIALVFFLFRRWVENENRLTAVGLCIVLACAALTRPEGILEAIAIGLSLAIRHKLSTGLGFMIVPALALGTFLTRNYMSEHTVSGYISQASQIRLYLAGHYWPLLNNGFKSLEVLTAETLFQAKFPYSSFALRILVSVWLTVFLGSLFVVGMMNSKVGGSIRILRTSVGLFVVLYFGMHSVFLATNTRYFFVLIPFILAGGIAGFTSLIDRSPSANALGGVLVVSVLCLYVNPLTSADDKVMWPNTNYRIPTQTYAWISQHTVSHAFLLTVKASTANLYTDRSAISEIPASDLEEFYYQLLKNHVTHILVTPSRITILEGQSFQNMLRLWLAPLRWLNLDRAAYRLDYANDAEKTWLYRVESNPGYVEAYEWCRSADQDFSNGQWEEGMQKIRKALNICPSFGGALNRLGMALWLLTRDKMVAEKYLLKAIHLKPTFAFALLNLASLNRESGNVSSARYYLERARCSLEAEPSLSGDPNRLKQMISSEIQILNKHS